MRMVLVLCLAVGLVGSASASVLIDFDTFSEGTPVGNNFGGYGVDFWDTGANQMTVNASYPGPIFSSPNSVYDYNQTGYGWRYWAEFQRGPAYYVSVVVGDFGADEDPVFMNAYDLLGNLVATDSDVCAAGFSGGLKLEVSASEIGKVEFWSEGAYPGSVLWDNFEFCPVPEPGAVSVLGLGVLGFAGLLKRRLA